MPSSVATKYHFVNCTDNHGRPPKNARLRKRLHRHVMLNTLGRARSRMDFDENQDTEDGICLTKDLLQRPSSTGLLAPSNLPIPHEFATTLRDMGISTMTKIEDMWKWKYLSDVRVNQSSGWIAEARNTWGKVSWDAALSDPLIFLMHLQVLLSKVATVTAECQDGNINLVASKALPILNERLRDPGKCNGNEAWSVTGFVYLAIRNKDYPLAKVHMNGLQLLLNLREADRASWPYAYWLDIRLAGLLNSRPLLQKAFNPALWPQQASLSKTQELSIECRVERHIKKLGSAMVPFQEMLRSCFIQLLRCELVQKSKAFNVVSQTEGLYSLSYDTCFLHGIIGEQPSDDRTAGSALLELVVIAMKLCTWSMCRYGVPQSGDVQETLLRRLAELLSDLAEDEDDLVGLLDTYHMDVGHALWMLSIAYMEAHSHLPSVQPALRDLLKPIASHMGIKHPTQMAARLQRMPCTELLYSKQLPFACRQILSNGDSQWQPVEDWSFRRKGSPLTGFLTALQFDIGEDDIV